MIEFKLREIQKTGEHIEVSVFAGRGGQTLANAGRLRLHEEELHALQAALGLLPDESPSMVPPDALGAPYRDMGGDEARLAYGPTVKCCKQCQSMLVLDSRHGKAEYYCISETCPAKGVRTTEVYQWPTK